MISPKYGRDDVNPERRNSPKGTAAEENIIAILLQHQDFIPMALEKLPVDKMITTLNRKIYKIIAESYENGKNFDFSYLGQFLSGSELGYVVSLQNSSKGDKNARLVLNDSINAILEEQSLKAISGAKDMSSEEWADNLANIIKNKTKGKM